MSIDTFEPQSTFGKMMKEKLAKRRNGTAQTITTTARPNPRLEQIVAKSGEHRTPAAPTPRPSQPAKSAVSQPYVPDSNAVDKFRAIHEFFIENKLFLTDAYDIKFKKHKTHKVTSNGSITAIRAKESYNSQILLSLLTHVGYNERGTKHNNTMLSQGDPGLGKTILAEYCGQFVFHETADQIADSTIQCHPQQTAETMVAHYDLAKLMQGKKEVHTSSWMKNRAKIIDEIQRLPDETIAIILQTIDSGKTKYGDDVIRASEGAITATMNAPDGGSTPIVPAANDRFQVSARYKTVNGNFVSAIIDQGMNSNQPLSVPRECYIDDNTILTARKEIRQVTFDKDAVRKLVFYISQIDGCDKAGDSLESKTKSNAQYRKPSEGLCVSCHYSKKPCAYFDNSVSMRATEAVLTYAKGLAWLRKKKEVQEEDVAAILPYVLQHRAEITPTAIEKKGVWENDRISFIKDTYQEASKQFIKYQNSIPEFKQMLDDLDNPHNLVYSKNKLTKETATRLEGYFDTVIQKMDDVAAFSYAGILNFALEHFDKNGNTN